MEPQKPLQKGEGAETKWIGDVGLWTQVPLPYRRVDKVGYHGTFYEAERPPGVRSEGGSPLVCRVKNVTQLRKQLGLHVFPRKKERKTGQARKEGFSEKVCKLPV